MRPWNLTARKDRAGGYGIRPYRPLMNPYEEDTCE